MTETTLVPIWLALIVAVPALAAPLLMAMLTNRNRRQEKEQEYARLDAVAEKAENVARALAIKAEDIARVLRETNELAERGRQEILATAKNTNDKIDVVHTIVNSNFTAAMESELDSRVIAVALMQEMSDLKSAGGKDPNGRTKTAIDTASAKIDELKIAIARRLDQQKKIDNLAEVKAGYSQPKE